MRVRYRELALSDLDRIFRYLDQRSPAGARKVIAAIHAAIGDVAQNPLGARRTSDPTVRVKVVSRYGYKIFYGVEARRVGYAKRAHHNKVGNRQGFSISRGHGASANALTRFGGQAAPNPSYIDRRDGHCPRARFAIHV
jgi:plasmid stabilization system protein ParE